MLAMKYLTMFALLVAMASGARNGAHQQSMRASTITSNKRLSTRISARMFNSVESLSGLGSSKGGDSPSPSPPPPTPAAPTSAAPTPAAPATSGFINVDAAGGNGEWGPFFGLKVAVPGVTKSEQMMMVDLGSSTLSFCDGAGMDEQLTSALADPPQGQCISYGSAGQGSFWVGSVYNTDVDLVSDRDTVGIMKNVDFSTMAKHEKMTCGSDGGGMPKKLAGIAGIAFSRGNTAYAPLPDPVATHESTDGACPCGGACPEGVQEITDPDAFMDFLTEEGDETFGLAWSGKLGSDQGRIYFGDAAKDSSLSPWNEKTALGPIQAIPQGSAAFADSGGWWQINVTGFSFNGKQVNDEIAALLPSYCGTHEGTCIMDTGNNRVTIPAMVCEDLGIDATAGTAGELTITVSDWAGSGSSVDLVVDASQFYDPSSFYNCEGETFVLGFAFWSFYYTVLDDVKDQVWYVPKEMDAK